MHTVILNGIDRPDLMDRALKGKRLAAVSSGSSFDRGMRHLIDLLHERWDLKILFNSVIGVRGEYRGGERNPLYTDARTGLDAVSIFCRDRIAPDPEMLRDLDAVVFDVKEAGVRYYEYLYVLASLMRACAETGTEVIVLDRPAPLGGETVEGTVCPPGMHTIVGDFELPNRIALTIGEFARYVNGEFGIGCPLTVIPAEGWDRNRIPDDTDAPWLNPSPSLNSVNANLVYAGYCLFEGITTVSEGRGTSRPFEYVGAPWIDGAALAEEMNGLHLPGVKYCEVFFRPSASKFAGEICHGVHTVITDRNEFRSVTSAFSLLDTIRGMYPGRVRYADCSVGHDVKRLPSEPVFERYIDLLMATPEISEEKKSAMQILREAEPALDGYRIRKQKYHLY